MGRYATVPRKVLVVLQFSVSIVLIIGSIVIYQQLQHGQNRPLGYNQDNLVTIYPKAGEIASKFELIKADLQASKAVEDIAKSSSPVTANWGRMEQLELAR